MTTVETLIDLDEQALAAVAEVVGITATTETFDAALREVGQRSERLCALARRGEGRCR
ncbi:hypothetical protein [Nocardia miyunensis]|uniref:hypothetical protein n=1 Tax=Nocardia miyunensis TaxID=282684 RepID=UPI000B0FB5D1|nr:hypothetical protein [Nocardia miyunensis]